jgi:hypothetical protein
VSKASNSVSSRLRKRPTKADKEIEKENYPPVSSRSSSSDFFNELELRSVSRQRSISLDPPPRPSSAVSKGVRSVISEGPASSVCRTRADKGAKRSSIVYPNMSYRAAPENVQLKTEDSDISVVLEVSRKSTPDYYQDSSDSLVTLERDIAGQCCPHVCTKWLQPSSTVASVANTNKGMRKLVKQQQPSAVSAVTSATINAPVANTGGKRPSTEPSTSINSLMVTGMNRQRPSTSSAAINAPGTNNRRSQTLQLPSRVPRKTAPVAKRKGISYIYMFSLNYKKLLFHYLTFVNSAAMPTPRGSNAGKCSISITTIETMFERFRQIYASE